MSFLDGSIQIADEKTCAAPWSGGSNGKYFRCAFCGHKFIPGDQWRCVYTNDISGACGNPLACESCSHSCNDDLEMLREKWKEKCDKWNASSNWWFRRYE